MLDEESSIAAMVATVERPSRELARVARVHRLGDPELYLQKGIHVYQPERRSSHYRLRHVLTDPHGIDWNRKITPECYEVLEKLGVFQESTFDAYATVRHILAEIAPSTAVGMLENLAERGIGDSFLHVILPDLDRDDLQLLIQAGWHQFTKDSGGQTPQYFWAPESALSTAVLEEIERVGYRGVVLAPHQLWRDGPGLAFDNRPTLLTLPNGRTLQAIPFDKGASDAFAFKDKHKAEAFAAEHIFPVFDRVPSGLPLVTFTDAETFGHHWKGGAEFLAYLLQTVLPERGVSVISINQLDEIWDKAGFDINDGDHNGYLVERSAWSCHCGDLKRWSGECSCGYNVGWKEPFYQLCDDMNGWVKEVVQQQFRPEQQAEVLDLLANDFGEALYNPGGEGDTVKSLFAARASALAARTSCGTFFEDPHTSGRINVLFMLQSIEHIRDAGLAREADDMRYELERRLRQIPDRDQPHLTLWDTMSQMLDARVPEAG